MVGVEANTPETIAQGISESRTSDHIQSGSQKSRQYGNITVDGGGLTINGDVYNNGTLFQPHSDALKCARLGLCLGSAPQIDPAYFVGRVAEIDAIHQFLLPETLVRKQQRVVLGGIGGVGKTQLAIAYAEKHLQSYDTVFWLNATSQSTIHTSLRLVAGLFIQVQELESLDNEQVLARVHRWLSNTENTRWLLIFDNYDEPASFDISQYCPYAAHGSIIITTRLPDYTRLSSNHIRLHPLKDIEESLNILCKRSHRQNVKDDPYARLLAERLAGLPLALSTAGAYLSKKASVTFQQYLQAYQQRWNVNPTRLLQLPEYDRSLYTTWDLSFSRLEDDDPHAAQLLKLFAYFDNQCVWYELLQAGVTPNSPSWLQRSLSDRIDFENAVTTLVDYCFLEVQATTQSYSMHNCIHHWVLAGLNKTPDKELYWYAFDCVLAGIDFDDQEYLGHLRYACLAPHASHLVHPWLSSDEIFYAVEADRISKVLSVAEFLRKQVQLVSAEQMCFRALTASEEVLGPEHSATLEAVHDCGDVYFEQGRFEEAEQMYLRALAGQQSTLGPNHFSTLSVLYDLGLLYLRQGNYQAAEEMSLRAISGIEKVLGPDHALALSVVNLLGALYVQQSKFVEAEQMYLRALSGREKLFGPDHVLTMSLVHELGWLFYAQDKFRESEQMYLRAINTKKKALGPNMSQL